MSLSAIVTTKNNASTLEPCLRSLRFANEIVVVDSGSTDTTLEVAQRYQARIFNNAWAGYGAQKNYGARQATGEWLLFIDADEEVPEQLQTEITKAIQASPVDFYWLRIVTVFLGKPLRHLYGHNPRLWRRDQGQWTTDLVHEQVATKTGTRITLGDTLSQVLPTPLMHHSHPTIASYLKRMNHYAALDAMEMKKTNQHRSGRAVQPTWWLPWQLAGRQLLKLLFYRKGFLDGPAGWTWCFLSSYYELTMGRFYLKP
jgi:glycosyltransferase involved in cell wall biosynthesis